MRFRLLAITAALLLIFVGRTSFAGPFGMEFDVDDEGDYLGIAESLMMGNSAETGGVSAVTGVSLFQSVLGTPFSIAPPIVDLIFAAIVIIVEEEENLLAAEDVDDLLQQLRPILFSELGFVRLACDDLTVEHRAKVRSAAEASLKRSASKMAAPQEPDQAEVFGVLLDKRPDPLSEIRQEIDKVMKEVLTAEKYAQYADLAANRVAHRKQAAILSIVAQLDEGLCLTLEQRQSMMDEISSNWLDEWEQWLEWYPDFSEAPKTLDPIVRPILDEFQLAVWKQTPKIQSEQILVVKQVERLEFNDGWWGDGDQMAPVEEGDVDGIPF